MTYINDPNKHSTLYHIYAYTDTHATDEDPNDKDRISKSPRSSEIDAITTLLRPMIVPDPPAECDKHTKTTNKHSSPRDVSTTDIDTTNNTTDTTTANTSTAQQPPSKVERLTGLNLKRISPERRERIITELKIRGQFIRAYLTFINSKLQNNIMCQ